MRMLLLALVVGSGCKKGVPTGPGAVDVSVDAIFDRFLEASGGLDEMRSVQNVRVEAVSTMPAAGITMSLVLHQERPDRSRMDVTVPGVGVISSGYSDGIAWEISPMMGPRLLSGREADDAARRNRLDLFENYPTHFPERRLAGTVDFAGVRCSQVETRTSMGNPETLYFAVDTGLWMGSQAVTVLQGGEANVTTMVEHYEEIAGVMTPTVTREKAGGFETLTRVVKSETNVVDFPDLSLPPEILELQGM